jgi:lysophospholipase L1-like esterase
MVVVLNTQHANANRILDRSPINDESPIVPFKTNRRGYIEPADRFPDPDYTVVFLGGSTTACDFVQPDMRFPARVSYLLEKTKLRVNTQNYGRSGNNTHHSLNNLLNHVVSDHPDYVVLMHAANDVGHLRATGGYEIAMGKIPTMSSIGKQLLQKASASAALAGLARHAMTLRKNKRDRRRKGQDRSVSTELSSEPFEDRLRAFVNLCRAFDIAPILMTQPNRKSRNELTPDWIDNSDQARFNQVIRDVAASEKVELVDLVAFLDARQQADGLSDDMLFYDGIHVTDYGSSLYAEHIAERLSQVFPDN